MRNLGSLLNARGLFFAEMLTAYPRLNLTIDVLL